MIWGLCCFLLGGCVVRWFRFLFVILVVGRCVSVFFCVLYVSLLCSFFVVFFRCGSVSCIWV